MEAQAAAERKGIGAAAEANQIRLVGEASAAKEAAAMEVYQGMDQATLLALALRDAAGSLPNIGNLTITPDLLSGALAGLLGGSLSTGDGARTVPAHVQTPVPAQQTGA
ncbi:hypothetical protein ACW0JT_07735 [Arthrobacter sp. SA17]